MTNILELNHLGAEEYFLRSKSYCNIELPQYFSFNEILEKVSAYLANKDLAQITSAQIKPYELDDVNYSFLNNKDGALSWRPFKIIHPAFYIQIVNTITQLNNWEFIIERFNEFQENKNIICYSLPIVVDHFLLKEGNLQITNWWMSIEQQSLQLAMEYSHIVHTDITNCYGSIYTHSIAWALHDKEFCKLKKNKNNQNLLGNKLDKYLREMSFGQTNGIPQGSNLMDFIAELVLGYSDLQLSKKLIMTNISNYKILRYRDDYRIFTNSESDAKILIKLLSETLFELGMSLNSQKTFASTDIIKSSLKEDKWFWIKHKQGNRSIQSHLLLIYSLSEKYPNSGSLKKSLMKFHERLSSKTIHLADFKILISITTAIMLKNPSVYMLCTAILSILFEFLETPNEVDNTLELIRKKFSNIPNTGHLEVWLQRMTLRYNSEIEYSEKLTQKVLNKNTILWNSDWISAEELKSIIDLSSIIIEDDIKTVERFITPQEMKFYFTGFNYATDADELEDYEPSY